MVESDVLVVLFHNRQHGHQVLTVLKDNTGVSGCSETQVGDQSMAQGHVFRDRLTCLHYSTLKQYEDTQNNLGKCLDNSTNPLEPEKVQLNFP